MRRKVIASGVLAVAAVCGSVGTVAAQPPSPIGAVAQPTFSPYLNLLRRENPTYLNYYGLVRPQQDFRQSLLTLRQDVNTYQSQVQSLSSGQTGLPQTGHRTSFLNTMGYFMTMSGGPGNRQGIPAATGPSGPAAAAGQMPAPRQSPRGQR
jgi:hypothetical protein